MGLFGKKKEVETLSISGRQLYTLLKKAVEVAAKEVNGKNYLFDPDMMIEYRDNVHFAGVRYDKKRAKKEKRITFSDELMTVYLDKAEFSSPEELLENGVLDGDKLTEISEGIIVDPEFADLLEGK